MFSSRLENFVGDTYWLCLSDYPTIPFKSYEEASDYLSELLKNPSFEKGELKIVRVSITEV